MSYLLDTNACIDVLKGHPRVVAHIESVSPAECAVSVVSVFELIAGVHRCARPAQEKKRLDAFLSVISVLSFPAAAAEQAASIRYELERQGNIIGPYDLLIAGHALSVRMTLVSNNTREFSRVEGLPLVDWRKNKPSS